MSRSRTAPPPSPGQDPDQTSRQGSQTSEPRRALLNSTCSQRSHFLLAPRQFRAATAHSWCRRRGMTGCATGSAPSSGLTTCHVALSCRIQSAGPGGIRAAGVSGRIAALARPCPRRPLDRVASASSLRSRSSIRARTLITLSDVEGGRERTPSRRSARRPGSLGRPLMPRVNG